MMKDSDNHCCKFFFSDLDNIVRKSALFLFILCQTVCLGAPLVIFDQPDLAGTGSSVNQVYTVYSNNQIPGGLNNKISSFYLNQGYMAIVADLADGTGPSETYIASDSDMAVYSLPANLDNAISFIRVIPWQETMKKGKCGWTDIPSLGESWYYKWGHDLARGQDPNPPYGQYVPMAWGKGGAGDDQIPIYQAMDQVTQILSFNEPDSTSQSNIAWDAAVGYHQNLQKAGLRLGSPACTESQAGGATDWLTLFIDECDVQDVRVDTISLHWYDRGGDPKNTPNANPNNVLGRFKRYLSDAYNRYRRPIWITEFNANPNRVRSVQDEFLQIALPYLEALGYVERYSYFQPNGGNGSFFDDLGQITSTGQIYNDHVSTPAYTPKILPSPWQNQDVGAVAAVGDAIHVNGTYTVCGTGAGITGTADEFQYVYQPVTGDGEIICRLYSLVWRGTGPQAGVMIRESLDAGSKHASMLINAVNGAQFASRTSTGGSSASTTQPDIKAPYWVKLVRQGNTLTGYYSPDGSSWTQLGSQTVSMSADVYVGLAATSFKDGSFIDGIFTDVSLTFGGGGDTTPPAAPTNLAAVANAGAIDLSWDANTEGDLDHYNVKRSNNSGSGYAVIDSTNAGTTSYTDLTAVPGMPYFYVVTAVDTSSNESGNSNEHAAPLYPGDLTLDNRVDLLDLGELGSGWQTDYAFSNLIDIASDWLSISE